MPFNILKFIYGTCAVFCSLFFECVLKPKAYFHRKLFFVHSISWDFNETCNKHVTFPHQQYSPLICHQVYILCGYCPSSSFKANYRCWKKNKSIFIHQDLVQMFKRISRRVSNDLDQGIEKGKILETLNWINSWTNSECIKIDIIHIDCHLYWIMDGFRWCRKNDWKIL